MRSSLAVLLAALVLGGALPAVAQQQRSAQGGASGPRQLGVHADWIAATYQDGTQKVCYAFTRPTRSEPGGRQNVTLSVMHRPGTRDQVTLSPGYAYPRNAEVGVTVGQTELPFYTSGANAFARDSDRVIAAFRAGLRAVAQGAAAGGRGNVTDTFSLSGFTAAYEAISRECPAGRNGG